MSKRIINIRKAESLLSKKIGNIYQDQLNHKLKRISYKLFNNNLAIMIEGTITEPERLLKAHDRDCLAKEIRNTIDEIVEPQIQAVIEDVLQVNVIDFLNDTKIERDLTVAIAILEIQP